MPGLNNIPGEDFREFAMMSFPSWDYTWTCASLETKKNKKTNLNLFI